MKKNQSLIMRIYQPYGDLKDESMCDYEVNYSCELWKWYSKILKAMDYQRQIINFHTNKRNFYLFYRALHEILTRIHIAENR